MTLPLIISVVANVVFIGLLVLAGMVIRGALADRQSMVENYRRRDLTGVQREEIRRRLIAAGMNGIGAHEVLDLIYTFRSVELGQYKDEDPYVPSDPYDDIDDYNPPPPE